MAGTVKIIGWGEATFPHQLLDNEAVLTLIKANGFETDKTGADVEKVTGIRTRRYASEDMSSTLLGLNAVRMAYSTARNRGNDFRKEDIKLIHYSTSSPDFYFPAGACRIQDLFGIPEESCEARDISLACSGFVDSLILAADRMKSASFSYGLVVAGEVIGSQFNSRKSLDGTLWGDGAGAVLLQLSQESTETGLLGGRTFSNGRLAAWAKSEGLGLDPRNRELALNASIEGYGANIQRYGIRHVPPAIETVCSWLNVKIDRSACLLAHNANLKMVEAIGEEVGIEPDRVLTRIRDRGNTSSASIPITLAHYADLDYFQSGDLLILAAFGAGMSISVALYRWP